MCMYLWNEEKRINNFFVSSIYVPLFLVFLSDYKFLVIASLCVGFI